jgi:hypothetical protein
MNAALSQARVTRIRFYETRVFRPDGSRFTW